MPVRRESLNLPDPNSSIWSDAHLKPLEDWFSAATYLMQEQQRQQEPDYTAREKQVDDMELFLDRLALLFAPTKVPKQSPKNVTATAYIRDKSNASRYVYIAKNNGFSGDDEDCAKWLDEWFRLKWSSCCEHNEQNEYWKNLLAFWKGRTEHYLKKAREVNLEEMNSSRNAIKQHFQEAHEDFDLGKFNEEWEEVSDILKPIGNPIGGIDHRKDGLNDTGKDDDIWIKYYNFWRRSTRQNYPPQRSRESQKEKTPTPAESAAYKYQRSIHHLEMLGMPVSIWKAMLRFRELKGGDTVQIVLIMKPFEDNLKVSKVEDLLNDWRINNGLDTSIALGRLRDMRKEQNIYLHCELQILLLFHQKLNNPNLRINKFIGCSKLSCHLCWEILKERNYKTRGTHGKVSANCAFPFPLNLDGMVETFKRLEIQWNALFKQHKDGRFPLWPNQLDTDPAWTDQNLLDKAFAKEKLDNMGIQGYESADLPYEIVPTIKPGRGSFAEVYAAYSSQTPRSETLRHYALKRIKIDSKPKLNLVASEIKILRSLKHQNILTLNEAYYNVQDPRIIYLATSPWAPATLQVFFRQLVMKNERPDWYKDRDPRDLDPWPSIIRQCLDGLTHLHSKGVIHKDLKPHNILLFTRTNPTTTDIRPIIADFGISKEFVPDGYTDNLGTHEFKAPELISNSVPPIVSDKRSDIWSLGCCFALIAILIWCGRPELCKFWKDTVEPEDERGGFHKDQNRRKLHELLQRPFIAMPSERMYVHHHQLRYLIRKMLQQAPENRPLAAAALGEINELDARLRVLELRLPAISICIRLGSKTVLEEVTQHELAPMKELEQRCYRSLEHAASSRGSAKKPTDIRIIFFEAPCPDFHLREFPSQSIDVVTEVRGSRLENLSTWRESLPFYEWIASQAGSVPTKRENEAMCGFEIGSALL